MYQSFPQKRICMSSNAMPIIPKPETKENNCQDVCKEKEKKEEIEECDNNKNTSFNLFNDVFKNLELDDIIIIGLILLLLYEGSEDWLTIGLLIVVLLL